VAGSSVPPSIGYFDLAWTDWDASSHRYRAYLWDRSIADSKPPIGLAHQYSYSGIDTYAYACRHEAQHVMNNGSWWPNGPQDSDTGELGIWPWDPPDADHDVLPDYLEPELSSWDGTHYSPTLKDTNGDEWDDGEDYTYSHMPEWGRPFQAMGSDWANPGQQTP
jgi:hypothetical protein